MNYQLETTSDGELYVGHWGLLFKSPEAALREIANHIREEDQGFKSGIVGYRCVEVDSNGNTQRVMWNLVIHHATTE